MRIAKYGLMLAAALVPTFVSAQQVQKSEDIVKFFADAVDLGASRGICVGTEDECKGKTTALEPEKTGLDMLINFDLNSADLTPSARAKLGEFATALKDNRLRSHDFVVEGYTDASGSDAYNAGLSERRAQAVTTFLLNNGVEQARLSAIGKGEKDPRTADPYDPVNRRVEMRIKLQ